jgi:hypothetical protein
VASFVSNEDIKAACRPFNPDGPYAQWTRVVYRLSDAPPAIGVYGELPFYVGNHAIWGVATAEAERLVAERQRQFNEAWGR